ncbi:MAG: hypothetical protein QNJ20_12455 [Paracoccaceae bacterium]|nr:hypothetical protein [Paracoccaceae bacterium]
MLKLSGSRLAEQTAFVRYIYFLFTSCCLKTFRSWQSEGEPNPFVKKTYRVVCTEQVEFTDIFQDVLSSRY